MPYINLNKVNLYYEEVGINEPVIFLHNAFSRGIIAFSAQIGMLQWKYRCILSGANDVSIKKKDIEILAENVKDTKIEIIDGCGHGPHLVTEKPVEVTKIIDEFLKEATITGDR